MNKKSNSSFSSTSNKSETNANYISKHHQKKSEIKKQKLQKEIVLKEETNEHKKYLKIINISRRLPNRYQEYPKLKYKEHIYSVNDTIMISNYDDPENDFIAILRKIIRAINQGVLHIIAEVQW